MSQQAIGRHEVQGPVPQSKGDPPVGRIYADHDPTPVHPGFSQHESGSPQSAQPGNRLRVDTTPTGGPGSPSPVAGDHRPVCNLADGKTPSVLCPSVGTQGNGSRCIPPTLGQPPGVCLPSNSHHKESSSQTESLSPLRSHPDRPLLASREWFPDLLELLSDIPIELPKRQDLLRQPHFHRFHENLQMLRLTAWRLSSDSHAKQASLKQWLANLPSVGEHLLD